MPWSRVAISVRTGSVIHPPITLFRNIVFLMYGGHGAAPFSRSFLSLNKVAREMHPSCPLFDWLARIWRYVFILLHLSNLTQHQVGQILLIKNKNILKRRSRTCFLLFLLLPSHRTGRTLSIPKLILHLFCMILRPFAIRQYPASRRRVSSWQNWQQFAVFFPPFFILLMSVRLFVTHKPKPTQMNAIYKNEKDIIHSFVDARIYTKLLPFACNTLACRNAFPTPKAIPPTLC